MLFFRYSKVSSNHVFSIRERYRWCCPIYCFSDHIFRYIDDVLSLSNYNAFFFPLATVFSVLLLWLLITPFCAFLNNTNTIFQSIYDFQNIQNAIPVVNPFKHTRYKREMTLFIYNWSLCVPAFHRTVIFRKA